MRQCLRSLKPCSTRARAADRALVGLPLGGGELACPGGLAAGNDDRVFGVGVQAGEPEVGESAEPGVAQAGGGDLAGGIPAGSGLYQSLPGTARG